MRRSLLLVGLILVAFVVGLIVALPWGVPPGLWRQSRLTVYVGTQKLDVVRNPGNGMVGVDDLGSLGGMLFEMTAPVVPYVGGWQMLGVNRPLEIAYFGPSGELLEVDRMEPCSNEQCPVYQPSREYLWVIETDVGTLTANPGDLLQLP